VTRALRIALVAILASGCARPHDAPPPPPDAAQPVAVPPVTAAPVATASASTAPAEPADASTPDASMADAAALDTSALDASAPDASAPTGPFLIDAAGIDEAAGGAVTRGEIAGTVIAVVHGERVVFQRAYGFRVKEPEEIPMTAGTVFDLASLTKVVATAPSIHLLIERGLLRLDDPVARHLPSFAKNGKERITVEHLLLHTGGLVADNAIGDYRGGRAASLARIDELSPMSEPGERFVYSDVGYIVLGELVEKISGQPLDVFARENLFEPLGMRDTTFNPSPALASRTAPTEPRDGHLLQGEVHDPRAHLLDGVAGHAGLFSTAGDLGKFIAMLLSKGRRGEKEILAPATLLRMTEPHELPGSVRRTLGWDVRPGFTGAGGYGHTGFTGTSLWLDPGTDTGLVVLTSRLYPDGKGEVSRLRREVAAAVARGRVATPPPPAGPVAKVGAVLTGVDVLERDGFAALKGRRVGLITNPAGIDHLGRSTVDVLRAAEGVALVALFSPEHGIRGVANGLVGDAKDARTGLPVYSLYGSRTRPSDEALKGLDTLVFDLQDAGARFYTYETTLGYLLETAAEHHLRLVVLDRPNPLGGLAVEGPVLEASHTSFTGYHTLPVRHGMTAGELAQLFNVERKIGADLAVVRLEGWAREQTFDRTGLPWVNPSPNLRSVDEALLYPGVALLDGTNVSVGRGTDRPFEQVGAPFLDGAQLATALTEQRLPGVRFAATSFTPASGVQVGHACEGVRLTITDRARFEPVRTALALALAIARQSPGEWDPSDMRRMLGHAPTYAALLRAEPLDTIVAGYQAELTAFLDVRKKYLLYGAKP
jgi:uncharacterized protein YbbC (DUF1343 family)/CubicO group peptidase (beta-lactamase class C family)